MAAPPISAPAVNTHAFSAPVTAGAPAVLAVVQAAFVVAAAQLALVPSLVTAQVPAAIAAVCMSVVAYIPATH